MSQGSCRLMERADPSRFFRQGCLSEAFLLRVGICLCWYRYTSKYTNKMMVCPGTRCDGLKQERTLYALIFKGLPD